MATFWTASAARLASHKSALLLSATTTLSASAYWSQQHASLRSDCEQAAAVRSRLQASGKDASPSVKLKSRMTSVGRFSLISETPSNPSIAVFFLSLVGEKPFTTKEFCQLWKDKEMAKRHPRFHVVVSEDVKGFQPEATKTPPAAVLMGQKKSDDEEGSSPTPESHVSETFFPAVYRKDLQSRISLLVSTPMDVFQSLWSIQIAPSGPLGQSGSGAGNTTLKLNPQVESLLFFRGHHVMADGVSLLGAFLDLCDEAEEIRDYISSEFKKRFAKKAKPFLEKLIQNLERLLGFCIGSFHALLYQLSLWAYTLLETNPFHQLERMAAKEVVQQDNDSLASFGARSISWATAAPIKEVKWVAQTLAGDKATINDVFVSCVSAAIVKQIQYHRQQLQAEKEAIQDIHGASSSAVALGSLKNFNIVMPVHLFGGINLPGQSMGNRIGAMIARVPGERNGNDDNNNDMDFSSVDRLQEVHQTTAFLKQTPTPLLSYLLARLVSTSSGYLLPQRLTSYLFSQANGGACAVVTNVRGPAKPLHLAGRRVDSLFGFVPLAPGIPIGIVVSSYAGNMKLTLNAETYAVPNGDQFLFWVLEEYQNLLKEAQKKQGSST